MRLAAASAFALVAAASLIGCILQPGQVVGDPAPYISFNGANYGAVWTENMVIKDSDLVPVGEANAVRTGGVQGTTVYGLSGVDPQQAVVMKTEPEFRVPYLLFLREGVFPAPSQGYSSERQPLLWRITGICRYLKDPGAEGCPS